MATPSAYSLATTEHVKTFCIRTRKWHKANGTLLLFGQGTEQFHVLGLALEPLDEGSNTGVDLLHRRSPLSPRLAGSLLGLAVAGLGRALALLAHGVRRIT